MPRRRHVVTTENFAGSIIVSLASLPDFLRKPMLTKRMTEFFELPEPEKQEIIRNALEAGPTVDFGRFEKLFRTWLEILAGLPQERRSELVGAYAAEISRSPERLVAFNMDAIYGIFLTLGPDQQESVASSVRDAVSALGARDQRTIRMIVPDAAQRSVGIG